MGVVRRRSGGSAVLVGPGRILWVDVVVPVDDPLWLADVARAGWWLGGCWAGALADVGIAGARVWRGAMVRSAWTPRVCFAGLGPGEVTVGEAGPKVVGISQRRTRVGALFQCAVPLLRPGAGLVGPWDPLELLDVLALSGPKRRGATTELAGVAVAVTEGKALTDALIARCRSASAPA